MKGQPLLDLITLLKVPNIGPVTAKNLLAYCGSPKEVLKEKPASLEKIPGVNRNKAGMIHNQKFAKDAEKEIVKMQKHQIHPYYYLENDYPLRLKDLNDAPVLLYSKGNADLNKKKMLAIVGTRRATDYGRDRCFALVEELSNYDVSIVSGLAFGIDYYAHKAAVDNGVETVGVMAHGLDVVYPVSHTRIAEQMIRNGGLVSDFFTGTIPEKEYFPVRNRIIAGLVDAVIVVETRKRGGALITADIAYSYNREVFAFPGKTQDRYSQGCNLLIKTRKAQLIESVNDIIYHLGWKSRDIEKKRETAEQELSQLERDILEQLKSHDKIHIDQLSSVVDRSSSGLTAVLLNLEMTGFIRSLPGNFYKVL